MAFRNKRTDDTVGSIVSEKMSQKEDGEMGKQDESKSSYYLGTRHGRNKQYSKGTQVNSKSKVRSKTMQTYTSKTILKAYEEAKNGQPIRTTALKYGIPPQTLRDRIIGKVDPNNCAPGAYTLLSSEVEEAVVEHVQTMAELGHGYTNAQLQELVGELAFELGHRNSPKAMSNNWLYGFLTRWNHKLSSPNLKTADRSRPTMKQISRYFDELNEILENNDLKHKPQFIFSFDETDLQLFHKHPEVISASNSKPQVIVSTQTTTARLIGCTNALGNSLPPYFVFKGKKWNSDVMKGASNGARGILCKSEWSYSTVFQNYLTEHFLPYVRVASHSSQPLLLLYSGSASSSLIQWANEKSLIIFGLPPHISHLMQPLGRGLNEPFKSFYFEECDLYKKKNGEAINMYNICEIACNAYLKSITPMNTQTAFRKAGIFPFSRQAISEEELFPARALKTDQSVNKETTEKITKETVVQFLQKRSKSKPQEDKNKKRKSLEDTSKVNCARRFEETKEQHHDEQIHCDSTKTAKSSKKQKDENPKRLKKASTSFCKTSINDRQTYSSDASNHVIDSYSVTNDTSAEDTVTLFKSI